MLSLVEPSEIIGDVIVVDSMVTVEKDVSVLLLLLDAAEDELIFVDSLKEPWLVGVLAVLLTVVPLEVGLTDLKDVDSVPEKDTRKLEQLSQHMVKFKLTRCLTFNRYCSR